MKKILLLVVITFCGYISYSQGRIGEKCYDVATEMKKAIADVKVSYGKNNDGNYMFIANADMALTYYYDVETYKVYYSTMELRSYNLRQAFIEDYNRDYFIIDEHMWRTGDVNIYYMYAPKKGTHLFYYQAR